jgi:hypothetical protein
MQYSTAQQIRDSLSRFVVEFPHFTEPGEQPRVHIAEDYRMYRWFPGMRGGIHPSCNYTIPSITVMGMIPSIGVIEEMLELRNSHHPNRILVIYIDGNLETHSFYVKISIGREGES